VAPRLLVVEDDDHIRTSLRWALEDEGYQVEEAISGEDACRRVEASAPDLMLVDLMLGRMDGFAVIREVRRAHDLPIIVVSARADTHDIVAALETGADDYAGAPLQPWPPTAATGRWCWTPGPRLRSSCARSAERCTGVRSSCPSR
jgi:DNA-binding response OmpR family regulator